MSQENVEIVREAWDAYSLHGPHGFHEVHTLRDGTVLRIGEHEHRADALEAAGLSE